MSEKVNVYTLELHHPEYGKQMVVIDKETTIGSARTNTVYYTDFDLEPRHCVFRVHQNILTIFQVAEGATTKIGRQNLENGRMYILENGDKVTMGQLKSYIRVKQEDAPEVDLSELEPEQEESGTDISFDEDEEIDGDEQLDERPSFFARLLQVFRRSKIKQEDEDEDETEVAAESDDQFGDNEDEDDKTPPPSNPFGESDKTANVLIKKPLADVLRTDPPAFLARFYALICELVIAYAIITNISPLFDLDSILDQAYSDLLPYVQKGITLASPHFGEHATLLNGLTSFSIITVLAVWLGISFLSHLILGCSFGLYLIGVRSHGKAPVTRLKGLVRFVLSLVTTPLILPDLPALVKKRTLKEVLTGTRLFYVSTRAKVFGTVFLLPLFTLGLLALPILLNLSLMNGPQVERINLPRSANADQMRSYHWRNLQVTLNFDPEQTKEWVYSPLLTKQGNKPQAMLHFAHEREGEAALISLGPVQKENLPQDQILSVARLDPFYDSKYPNLAVALETKVNTTLADEDRLNLYLDTLSLNWETLPQFIMERGLVIGPYLNLKNQVMVQLGVTENDQVTARPFGKKLVLEFNNGLTSIYKAILDEKFVSVSLKASNRPSLNKFLQVFWSHSVSLTESIPAPHEQGEQWTPFDFFDYFSKQPFANLEKARSGLANFMGAVLSQRLTHPWSRDLILNDYKRTMDLLQELRQNDPNGAITQAFQALNIEPTLWSDNTLVPQKEK